MPICGSSRSYKFEIFSSDKISHADLIAKILQMPQIDCCSNVEIKLNGPIMHLMEFQIEPISNWLHQNCNGTNEKSDERFLLIYSFNSPFSVLCVRELCDTFKKEILVIFRKFHVIEIQAFVEAKIRVCPFTLKIESCSFFDGNTEEKGEIILNKNTNEELLIVKKLLLHSHEKYGNSIEIKRGAQKKNLKKSY